MPKEPPGTLTHGVRDLLKVTEARGGAHCRYNLPIIPIPPRAGQSPAPSPGVDGQKGLRLQFNTVDCRH
eukprot:476575-Pyramimonas_sp.AAC.1